MSASQKKKERNVAVDPKLNISWQCHAAVKNMYKNT